MSALRPPLSAALLTPPLSVPDPSFSTFTYTWSSSERVTKEWAVAFQRCRTETCSTEQACVERQCYTDAAAVAHPLSGGGVNMTLPWLLRAAHGEHAKFIIMLRDPVERFHAAFWNYEHYQNYYGHFNRTFQPVEGLPRATEASFSSYANECLDNVERCLSEGYSERECFEAYEALTPQNEKSFYHLDQCVRGGVKSAMPHLTRAPPLLPPPCRLLKSMHAHWMAGWLEAFPRTSFLVLRLEDIRASEEGRAAALRAAFAHLDLVPPPSEQALADMAALPVRRFRNAPRPAGQGEVEAATLTRLRAFFAPHNARLAKMLGDDAFTWGY